MHAPHIQNSDRETVSRHPIREFDQQAHNNERTAHLLELGLVCHHKLVRGTQAVWHVQEGKGPVLRLQSKQTGSCATTYLHTPARKHATHLNEQSFTQRLEGPNSTQARQDAEPVELCSTQKAYIKDATGVLTRRRTDAMSYADPRRTCCQSSLHQETVIASTGQSAMKYLYSIVCCPSSLHTCVLICTQATPLAGMRIRSHLAHAQSTVEICAVFAMQLLNIP